jgi:hypothetical protein
MTAIAGLFNADSIKHIHARKMIAELECYFQKKDYWENNEFAASRLHHGTIAPSYQPAKSEDGKVCLFMDGELYNSDELQNNKTSTILDQAQFCLSLYLKGRNEDYALLDDLLENSHVVSVNLPLENHTMGYVAKDIFDKMKQIPWFVNTSRGAIVNEDALLEALKEKKIKGAAVDVLSNEVDFMNKRAENQLIEYAKNNDNLLITPHIAGSTWESVARTAFFIENKILEQYPHFSS